MLTCQLGKWSSDVTVVLGELSSMYSKTSTYGHLSLQCNIPENIFDVRCGENGMAIFHDI